MRNLRVDIIIYYYFIAADAKKSEQQAAGGIGIRSLITNHDTTAPPPTDFNLYRSGSTNRLARTLNMADERKIQRALQIIIEIIQVSKKDQTMALSDKQNRIFVKNIGKQAACTLTYKKISSSNGTL